MLLSTDTLEGLGSMFDHLLNIKGSLIEQELFCIKFVQSKKIRCQVSQSFRFEENDI